MALSATLNIVSAPSLAASKVIQDLTYTAQSVGAAGDAISITYIDPGMMGSIAVGVVGNAITVTLASDGMAVTSTASQIKTAVDASSPAHALVSVAVSGTGSTVQTAQSITHLTGGFDTALSAPQNQPIPCVVKISNSGGTSVIVDAIYPRITSPNAPAMEFDNPILPQPITIAATSGVAYVTFSAIIFGTEAGTYVFNCDVCSSSSQLLATPPIPASVTLE